MSEESEERSPQTFSFEDVVFSGQGPVVVQLESLAILPESERNASAWLS